MTAPPLDHLARPFLPEGHGIAHVDRLIGDCATCGATVDSNFPSKALDEHHAGCRQHPRIETSRARLRAAQEAVAELDQHIDRLEDQLARARSERKEALDVLAAAKVAVSMSLDLRPASVKVVGTDDDHRQRRTFAADDSRTCG